MIYLLVGYLIAIVFSLFIASWRIAVWALALEALITGLLLIRGAPLEAWSARVQVVDIFLMRSLLLPLGLFWFFKKLRIGRDFDIVPPNFVVWTAALALVIGSFWFGQRVFPTDLQSAVHVGTSVAGVLAGFFILANQTTPAGQLIGLLTLEGGILLIEVFSAHTHELPVQLGITIVFAWTLGLLWRFFKQFAALAALTASSTNLRSEEKEVL